MRHEKIGRGDAGDPGEAERSDPEQTDAGHEEQRDPDERDEQRLAEVRLEHEHEREDGVESDRKLDAGHVRALLALVEQPGGQHHESRLHELRRLDREEADLEPALGALDLRAHEHGRGHERDADHEDDEARAADLLRRQSVEAANMMTMAGKAGRLTAHEIERLEIELSGDRRACGERQNKAGAQSSSRPKNIRRSTVNHQSDSTLRSARVILMPPCLASAAPGFARKAHDEVAKALPALRNWRTGRRRKPATAAPPARPARHAAHRRRRPRWRGRACRIDVVDVSAEAGGIHRRLRR